MLDVETAVRVGLPPFITQANPDTDVGIRNRLTGVGGDDLEVKHAAGLGRGRLPHQASRLGLRARTRWIDPISPASEMTSEAMVSPTGLRGTQR